MATILTSLFRHTQEWHQIVRDSAEDEFIALDQMIEDGICRTTESLAHQQISGMTRHELTELIIDLLADHATKLPSDRNPDSVKNYLSNVTELLNQAENEGLASLAQKIERLRLKGYRLSPHSKQEIRELVQAKCELLKLKQIALFCCEIETLSTFSPPSPGKIKNLLAKAAEFSDSTLKVYKIAQGKLLWLQSQSKREKPPLKIEALQTTEKPRSWQYRVVNNCKELASNMAYSILKALFAPIRYFL